MADIRARTRPPGHQRKPIRKVATSPENQWAFPEAVAQRIFAYTANKNQVVQATDARTQRGSRIIEGRQSPALVLAYRADQTSTSRQRWHNTYPHYSHKY